MGLLDLVEQHHAVGLAAHLFGELAGLIVAHIARRRTDQAADRVLLHELTHVQTDQRVHRVKQLVGQLLHQLGFAHAGGADEDEAGRAAAAGQVCTGALDGLGHQLHGLILADDLGFERALQALQLGELALLDLHRGDAGPQLDDPGHILHAHGDVLHLGLQRRQFVLQTGQLGAQVGQLLIVQRLISGRLLQAHLLLFQLGHLLLGLLPAGQLRMAQVAAGTGLVQQVNGLIGQEAVGDVPLRQAHRRVQHIGGNLHLVVALVIALDALHQGDGIGNAGLFHLHGLEAAFQSLILFDVLAVLGKGGGADHLNLPAGQGRLQDVGGVHRALGIPCAGDVVNLVNEQDDVARSLYFADQALHPLFELAAELGARHQGGQVQQEQLLIPQAGGHIAAGNALGNALGNGRFAHACLTDEAGVVLLAAAEDLNGAVDLRVPADDGVQLACPGLAGQVLAVVGEELALLGLAVTLLALFAFLVLFLLAAAKAEGKHRAAAGGEAVLAVLAVLFVPVRCFHRHGEHPLRHLAVLAHFLHEVVHALLHALQVLVRHAEALHHIVQRLDVQLTGTGEAIALVLGLVALHPLDEYDRLSFFASGTQHGIPLLSLGLALRCAFSEI